MRKFDPNDSSDVENAKTLNVKKWQLDALALNPEYVWWGNFEDYMASEKDKGWNSPIEFQKFSEMFTLDELNECVNFYFTVNRASYKCTKCDETGYNSATKRIADDWYDFEKTGRKWCNKITDDEVETLIKKGRLGDLMPNRDWYSFSEENNCWEVMDRTLTDEKGKKGVWVKCEKPVLPTAEKVNNWADGRGFGHDAINKHICIEVRAKREGVYGLCNNCNGRGYVFTEPYAKLQLQLWVLHPRKGCSRGVFINEILQKELPKVREFLREASNRNSERFSKV